MARWITTDWKLEDLQGKTVSFDWKTSEKQFQGKGRLVVTKNSFNELFISIQPNNSELDPRIHLVVGEQNVRTLTKSTSPESEFVCVVAD